MSRVGALNNPQSIRRLALITVASAAGLALLVGCGAGQITQTGHKETSITGINTDQGNIAIRNAYVQAATNETGWKTGATVPLVMTLSNKGRADDELIEATSPHASGVQLVHGQLNATTEEPSLSATPSASASTSEAELVANTASPTAAASASASPSATATESSTEGEAPRVSIKVGKSVYLAQKKSKEDASYLVLQNLASPLDGGDVVEVRLTFAKSGSITLKLPVTGLASPRPRESLTHDIHQGPGEH